MPKDLSEACGFSNHRRQHLCGVFLIPHFYRSLARLPGSASPTQKPWREAGCPRRSHRVPREEADDLTGTALTTALPLSSLILPAKVWSRVSHRGFHGVPPPMSVSPDPGMSGAARGICTPTVWVLGPVPLLVGLRPHDSMERGMGFAPMSEPWHGPILLLDEPRLYAFGAG